MTAEKICEELNIDYSKILNIYPYGSRVYLCDDEFSDSDYIIVYKASILPSGAFRDNAISSVDFSTQAVCFSRGGFIDAINNYDMSALECIFLPEDKIIQKKMNFGITKYNQKDLAKKVITKASSSWHFSILAYNDENIESSQKNIYHALRILNFGIQIKENKKIIDYSSMNDMRNTIYNDVNYKPFNYLDLFMKLSEKIKNEQSR